MSPSQIQEFIRENKSMLQDVENSLRNERPGQYSALLSRNELAQRVIHCLQDVSGADDIELSSNLYDDLGLDDLDFYDLVDGIQKAVDFTTWGRLKFYQWELKKRNEIWELQLSGSDYEPDSTVQELIDLLYGFEPVK